MASDTTPEGNILTETEATWTGHATLAVDAVDDPTQLPWPVPADAPNRFTAKKSNSFSEAFRRIVRWIRGVDVAGDSATPMRFAGGLAIGDGAGDGPRVLPLTGDPEGVVTAPPGSIGLGTNGTWYRKVSGTGNTGWVDMTTPVPP